MRIGRYIQWALAPAVISAIVAATAMAQPPDRAGRGPGGRGGALMGIGGTDQDVRELVETLMVVRLSRELELSEDQTVLLVRRIGDHRETLNGLQRERRRLMQALREAVNNAENDGAVSAKLEELKVHDRKIADTKLELHAKLAEGLDLRQQARLFIFLQDFEENMRRTVERVRERSRMLEDAGRGGRGGRGGPPPGRDMRERRPESGVNTPPRDREMRERSPEPRPESREGNPRPPREPNAVEAPAADPQNPDPVT